jgi:hypothetical protein
MPDAERNLTNLPAGAADEGNQLGLLLDSAREMVDEEFRRAERLEGKSRNQFTAVGGLFAVVMATTAGVLNLLPLNNQKVQGWVYPTVGGCAAFATLAMGIALALSLRAWKTSESDALDAQTIRDYVPYAERGNVAVAKRLIEAYAAILDDRRAQNKTRVGDLKCATKASVVAAIAVLVQLVAVFAAIIVK